MGLPNERGKAMDIPCKNCGEPWETETFHEVAEQLNTTYAEIAKAFSEKGCRAFDGSDYEICDCYTDGRASLRSLLAEALGDDLDGYSSTLDDLEYLGLL